MSFEDSKMDSSSPQFFAGANNEVKGSPSLKPCSAKLKNQSENQYGNFSSRYFRLPNVHPRKKEMFVQVPKRLNPNGMTPENRLAETSVETKTSELFQAKIRIKERFEILSEMNEMRKKSIEKWKAKYRFQRTKFRRSPRRLKLRKRSKGKRQKNNRKIVLLESVKLEKGRKHRKRKSLKNNRKKVLQAVKNYGGALQDASKKFKGLKADRKIVLEAVKYRADSLQYASEELKNDRKFVIEAMKYDVDVLKYASEELRNDRLFVKKAFEIDFRCFDYVGKELLQNNPLLRILQDCRGRVEDAFERYYKEKIDNYHNEDPFWEIFLKKKLKISSKFRSKKPIRENIRTIFAVKAFWFPGLYRYRISNGESQDIKNLRETLRIVRFNDLEIHRFLGGGSYARTYLCQIKGFRTQIFVVKIFLPRIMKSKEKRTETFERECLEIPYHKNIVSILSRKLERNESEEEEEEEEVTNYFDDVRKLPDYETFWKKNQNSRCSFVQTPILLMKYHRMSLDSFMTDIVSFPQVSLYVILLGIISGAFHLYQNFIVHRDLHPGNIFLDPPNGRVWIGDFGCALDLRNNEWKFYVHKDHEIMFSYTNYTGFGGGFKSEYGWKKGGASPCIPPEITEFDPFEEDYLNYEKSDLYSIGVVGMDLLQCMKCQRIDEYERGGKKFEEFTEKFLEKDINARISWEEAIKAAT